MVMISISLCCFVRSTLESSKSAKWSAIVILNLSFTNECDYRRFLYCKRIILENTTLCNHLSSAIALCPDTPHSAIVPNEHRSVEVRPCNKSKNATPIPCIKFRCVCPESPGSQRKTFSDCALIVHLFALKGLDALTLYLNGQLAI